MFLQLILRSENAAILILNLHEQLNNTWSPKVKSKEALTELV